MDIKPVFLVLHNERETSDIFSTSLEHEYHAEIYEAKTFEEAVKTIDKLEGLIDGIVTTCLIDDKEVAKSLLNYLDENAHSMPVIVLGNVKNYEGAIEVKELPADFDIDDVFSFFNTSIITEKPKDPPEYVPIPIHYFYTMGAVFCDVYLKINKNDGNHRYLKRMYSGNTFDKSDIVRYQEKFNVTSFYIKETERKFFINNLIKQTVSILQDTTLSEPDRKEATSDAYNMTADLLLTEGLTPETEKAVSATMNSIKEIMKKNKKIATLLKDALVSKESYAFKRVNLLSSLAVKALQHLDWATSNKDLNSEIVRKIIYFSFFHDIFLRDEDSHRVHSQRDLNLLNPDINEKQNIIEHASKASALVRQFPQIPMGVDSLIANHHGVRTGMGFAVNYSSNLPPLLILLIVVEEYVVKLLDSNYEEYDDKEVVESLYGKHTKSAYKKSVEALEKVISAKE